MLAHHKGVLTVAVVLALISSGLGLAQPMVINQLIETVGKGPISHLAWTLVVLLVVSSIVSAVQFYVLTVTAETAVKSTRHDLIGHMLRLPISVYDRFRTGDLVTRLGSDTTIIREAFTGGLVSAIGGLATMIGAIVLMALVDVFMLALVLTVVTVTLIAVIGSSALIQRYTKRAQEAVGDLGAGMDRALVAVRTIRASGAQNKVEADLRDEADNAWRQGVNIARVAALIFPAAGLALQGSFLLVLGIGGARVAAGTITVADLVTFVLYLFMVSMPLGSIFGAITTIRAAMGAIERIEQIMGEERETSTGVQARPAHSVRFDDVSFAYAEDSPVLVDVSVDIPAGTKTAIVGPSGSGKSTMLALIERFYDPTSGRLYLGDQEMADLTRESVRDVIGYVEQEAAVLAGSIRDNLLLATPDATDEQCWWALDQVNLRERMEEADGLDTVLGDRGLTLSGGQRQRLALARMLLMDSPILLLDEPTSAVDSQNEQLILDAIDASAADRTLVVVAHRLSTVTDADQIIVLDDGRVAG
ncbi:MAG: ABC transporter ATP-binding protein, partial [Corynebacterium pollutisoli]|nr:ABC transporter ATP-binding protein [Corynebacterium pollutisoli]